MWRRVRCIKEATTETSSENPKKKKKGRRQLIDRSRRVVLGNTAPCQQRLPRRFACRPRGETRRAGMVETSRCLFCHLGRFSAENVKDGEREKKNQEPKREGFTSGLRCSVCALIPVNGAGPGFRKGPPART